MENKNIARKGTHFYFSPTKNNMILDSQVEHIFKVEPLNLHTRVELLVYVQVMEIVFEIIKLLFM
jgi:hypothetical protein